MAPSSSRRTPSTRGRGCRCHAPPSHESPADEARSSRYPRSGPRSGRRPWREAGPRPSGCGPNCAYRRTGPPACSRPPPCSFRSAEQPLDDDAVAPLAVEPAMALVDADYTEAAALVEREARDVLREDAGHDLPEAPLRVGPAESVEGGATRPGSPGASRDVHRMLRAAGVGGPTAIGAGARPGDHFAVTHDDDRGIAVALLRHRWRALGGRRRLGLERSDPVRDALVVDARDGRGVLGGGETDRQIHHADRGVSQPKRAVASPAPRSCATMNAGASAGRIPAKVSVADRASVTAGFAKDVEAGNHDAPRVR